MIIDGKKIAEDIKMKIKEKLKGRNLSLGIVYVNRDPVIDQFIRIKKRFGEDIGVTVNVYDSIEGVSDDGIIVQLPGGEDLIDRIPKEKDVDALREDSAFTSPVVLAIQEVFRGSDVKLDKKKVAVIGKGRLVGKPVIAWLKGEGIEVTAYEKGDKIDVNDADVIISGAGIPHLIKLEMIKEGVILIDAGTSEISGEIKGDVDPDCALKAKLLTPVPGGIGPIAIAALFRNLTSSIN